MADSTLLGDFFVRDAYNPVVVTANPSATSQWFIARFGAKTIKGKDSLEWLALSGEPGQQAEWVVKIKLAIGNPPQAGISHLALRLKFECSLDEVARQLIAEKFTEHEHGKIDEVGFGWRILKAPESIGGFYVHLARRPEDAFVVAM